LIEHRARFGGEISAGEKSDADSKVGGGMK
jgi:hypothetical protein